MSPCPSTSKPSTPNWRRGDSKRRSLKANDISTSREAMLPIGLTGLCASRPCSVSLAAPCRRSPVLSTACPTVLAAPDTFSRISLPANVRARRRFSLNAFLKVRAASSKTCPAHEADAFIHSRNVRFMAADSRCSWSSARLPDSVANPASRQRDSRLLQRDPRAGKSPQNLRQEDRLDLSETEVSSLRPKRCHRINA